MDYTQSAKIAQVTEKTLVVGVDVGSETHYARAINWRGQELSKKAFHFSNDQGGYLAGKSVPCEANERVGRQQPNQE